MKFFLKETIFLLPILLMGVSFLSIIFDLNFVIWGNIGGYSLVTDILFVYVFYYGRYCVLTKILPFGLIISNLVNVFGYFYPKNYSTLYEIVIFSVILSGVLVYELKRRMFNDPHTTTNN